MRAIDKRTLEYLHESNAIEDITHIDYSQPDNAQLGRGHMGAFVDSQQMAHERRPIFVNDLCRWQGMICEEQVRFGVPIPVHAVGAMRSRTVPYNVRVANHIAPSFDEVPTLVASLISDLNQRLAPLSRSEDAEVVVAIIGDFFQRFEAIHPFVDGNGRTGRLLANYIATYLGCPIIVFRASERPAFYAAHRSKMAMRCFIADKIRECVFTLEGKHRLRTSHHGAADRYDVEGHSLIVEWHELVAAQQEWRALADKKR